jgi:hypothetical protein
VSHAMPTVSSMLAVMNFNSAMRILRAIRFVQNVQKVQVVQIVRPIQ